MSYNTATSNWDCTTVQTLLDSDADGVMAWADCDDNDPNALSSSNDNDCDGVTTPFDCNDSDPSSNTTLVDADCDGTRTTVAGRFFLTPTTATPELAPIIAFFRDGRDALARDYGVDLTDTYLRIELAADTEEFWQVPHIDTKEKRITIIVFLTSDHPGDLGTDLGTSNATDAQRTRVPWAENRALVFRTATGRWHSFTKRSFVGVRRVLLANFVEAANWRSLDQVWDLDAVDV